MGEWAMSSTPAPISLAGSLLRETRHVCAFFDSDEEEYRVLLPFIKDGLKSGDRHHLLFYASGPSSCG
jgi:hypothetical protein